MGTKDRLLGLLPDNLKPPLTPETYDGFITALSEQGARKLRAIPGRKPIDRRNEEITGERSTHWRYNVGFVAEGRHGRKITYEFPLVTGTTQDDESRNEWGGKMLGGNVVNILEEAWLITAFVTAEELLRRIKEELPECETELISDGKPFTEEDFQTLHEEAKLAHIRPLI